jgi:hypothetical protein
MSRLTLAFQCVKPALLCGEMKETLFIRHYLKSFRDMFYLFFVFAEALVGQSVRIFTYMDNTSV